MRMYLVVWRHPQTAHDNGDDGDDGDGDDGDDSGGGDGGGAYYLRVVTYSSQRQSGHGVGGSPIAIIMPW